MSDFAADSLVIADTLQATAQIANPASPYLLLILGLIPGVKFLLNLIAIWQLSRYRNSYKAFTLGEKSTFHTQVPTVVGLFKKAGLEGQTYTWMEPIGYGQMMPHRARLFDNLHIINEETVGQTITYFDRAKGVFRMRMLDAINPIYWLETFIFLPKTALVYLGVPGENIAVKVLQLVYWAASAALAVIQYMEASK